MRLIGREVAGWLLVVLGVVLACTALLLWSGSLGGLLLSVSVGVAALALLLGGTFLLGSLSLELAGWLLLLGGLVTLFNCYGLIEKGLLFEAAPLSIIGIIIFRGGIHLLKVAVAARICMQAKEQARQEAAVKTARPAGRTAPSSRGPAATTAAARGS